MQPLGLPPVPDEYTMHAKSCLVRGTNSGLPFSCAASQRNAPDKSALTGDSVTNTVLIFVAASRPGESLNCRHIGYSVINTLLLECFKSCHCSSGFSL